MNSKMFQTLCDMIGHHFNPCSGRDSELLSGWCLPKESAKSIKKRYFIESFLGLIVKDPKMDPDCN
jgi:hypothetical protein